MEFTMLVGALSNHARIRMQQRGIPTGILECLLEYGHAEHDHQGSMVVFFDKSARHKLKRSGLAQARLEKHLNAYAVVTCDGTVATVGHRYKRIPRP
jgi:hypothetical protein